MTNENILKILKELLTKVGNFQVEKFTSKSFTYETKSSAIDIVTEVDKTSEDLLIKELRKIFPEHGYLAEESGTQNTTADYIWVIDPLDGTTNFSVGIPIFAISIGLQKNGETILGAVHIPMTGITYSAIKDKGAYKNDVLMKVSTAKTLRESVIATGFPYDRAENSINNVKEFTKIVTKVKGIRRLGVAAYDLCLVAEGVFSGYWEYGLKPWDYVAGLLIASEAGAVYEALPNRDHSMIVSNPLIFDELKSSLK